MRIVLLNQYYPPDAAPTGVMLESVARDLVAAGHVVTVFCAAGGYAGNGIETPVRGTLDAGVAVVRIRAARFGRGSFVGKLVDYISYYAGAAWRLLWIRPKPDRIVALTTPPYLSVLARIFSKLRGADHAHWVMDIYPEVMVAHGMLPEGGVRHRMLAGLARWGMGGKRCAGVLALGPCMAERLQRSLESDEHKEQGGSAGGRVKWVPLWSGTERTAGEEEILALRAARGWGMRELVVMYSGNMGLGHRFNDLLDVMAGLAEPVASGRAPAGKGMRFVFFGRGRRREEVARFLAAHPGFPAELHDYVPEEQLAAHLQTADLHVVSLDPAWSGTMLPSKLQGVFAAKRPVIFIGAGNSSMAEWIHTAGAGWVINAGDVDSLRMALNEAEDTATRLRMGEAAGLYAARHFDQTRNAARVAEFLGRK